MQALVPSEYLGEIDYLLEWAIPREGFDIGEGVEHDRKGIKAIIIPFVRWLWEQCKYRHRMEARRGWEALKLMV
ncbi:hypothetical protein SUGI_0194150 [Cryptomeria japonica]|nr:hypothetical protein SUGI_0194150 [Cryptomeria japonica]